MSNILIKRNSNFLGRTVNCTKDTKTLISCCMQKPEDNNYKTFQVLTTELH